MDGQAPHPVAVAPESLPQPPPRLETEAEDDPVVVPDAPDAASSEPSKVGALSTSPRFKAEDDPLIVPVIDASSEASDVVTSGVVLTDELRDKIVNQVYDGSPVLDTWFA